MIGGNNPPVDRTFKKRWASALFARPDKPAGAVAMGFKIYMEMDSQGRGATISDAEFQVACGVSDGACRTFKRWLVNAGFIQIMVRGRRGYRSEFLATVPDDHIAAAAAAWKAEHELSKRQPIPANNDENHASLPATTAAISAQTAPACARIEPPSGVNNIIKQTTTTAVESEAGRSSGFDFDALNGSAVDLIEFIAKHTSTDKQNAARMLQTNIRAFTADAMLEAFSVTLAEMAGKGLAQPYKYLMETARKMKAKAAGTTKRAADPNTPTRRDRIRQYVEEAQSKQEPRNRYEQ